MFISPDESRAISVHASQGEIVKLKRLVGDLAAREGVSTADVLGEARDDFQQTAAHMAAKAGQVRSIEALAEIIDDPARAAAFFNLANRFTGDRPVHTAMRAGYLDVLRALVRHGADPTVKNRFGDVVGDYLSGDFEEEGEVTAVVDAFVVARGEGGNTKKAGVDAGAGADDA
ncbi:hypothetical protein QBC47DRAFT_145538 [Echria macrotheca]|uniref:Ankyrin repeat domain-containing protein n=1 Tax=Echria macrotheca TaxID=438768 RepID=A0AAJ0FEB7_9PEZI|nr:hypothetical protein QBC47DRAFT_145538 [Echria macrotheca]